MGSCSKEMYRYVQIYRCRQTLEAIKQIIIVFDRAILTLLQIYMTMNIICIDCDKGYYGPYCDFKCPFPLYGYDCQSVCDCNVTYCDHVNGCIKSTGGKIS